MIAFVYGTTAELIKIAPVRQRLVALGARPLLWSTGQQASELPETTRRLRLPEPDFVFAEGFRGRSLHRTADVPVWLATVTRAALAHRQELLTSLWEDDRPPIVLVHGDTMTTVVGAALGRWLGVTVGHIEAGLRTNRILEPFPEELDRRVAARLAHVHFAPGIDKFLNLRGIGGIKVDTVANTVIDTVRSVPDQDLDHIGDAVVPDRFGLVSLHRFELVRNRERFDAVLAALARHARDVPMLVVTDALASAQIEAFGLGHHFDDRHLIRVGKLAYFDFVTLLRRAEFVVTDSGGLQEECAYLNIACLVHRTTTERNEGIGTNVVLSMYDIDAVDDFLDDPSRYRDPDPEPLPSPSDVIVEHLVQAGHSPGRGTDGTGSPELSVVVPAFGHADLIRSALHSALRSLDRIGLDYEIVVLGDPADSTRFEVSQVGSDRVRMLTYADNAGAAGLQVRVRTDVGFDRRLRRPDPADDRRQHRRRGAGAGRLGGRRRGRIEGAHRIGARVVAPANLTDEGLLGHGVAAGGHRGRRRAPRTEGVPSAGARVAVALRPIARLRVRHRTAVGGHRRRVPHRRVPGHDPRPDAHDHQPAVVGEGGRGQRGWSCSANGCAEVRGGPSTRGGGHRRAGGDRPRRRRRPRRGAPHAARRGGGAPRRGPMSSHDHQRNLR
ncbi:MAG: UDP-N-acetylglucosamine 2-epimerase [Microthrixaceae bacterium]